MQTAPVTVLGFDFGLARIGVAVGSSLVVGQSGRATPLAVLRVQSRAQRIAQIEPYVAQWRPDRLVVGKPLYPDGQPHEMTLLSEKFARQIKEHFALPVCMVDERYTSVQAAQDGADQSNIDAHAAALIVQQYFSQISDLDDIPTQRQNPS